jgi:hypothetical protein
MKVRDLAAETWNALDANRGRSALTVLGIVIGISAVIAMTALIGGINKALVGELGLSQAQLVYINVLTGTPLTYEAPDGVAVAAGAFDDPAALPPRIQYGLEARLPFVDGLHRLPAIRTEADLDAAPFLAQLVSHQHPDHDTERWPA